MNTAVLKVDPLKIGFDGFHALIPPSKTLDNLRAAADLLRQNQPVAFPTETVYGLGANCQNTAAVQSIYNAKNRPADNPLIVHVSSQHQIESALGIRVPPIYHNLVAKFWPGPLTILLPLSATTNISPLCTKGQSTVGVRIPRHPVARALIELSGLPLAAPSANASTKPSCTTAEHVLEDMEGRIPLILDGGASDVGVESTVVDGLVDPPQILRPGGISLEQIRAVGGADWADVVVAKPASSEHATVRAPGMKYRHYSPYAPVILVDPGVTAARILDALPSHGVQSIALLRSKTLPPDFLDIFSGQIFDMPLGSNGSDISHNLFTRFREADEAKVDAIIVEGVDLEDEGLAIMNRVHKAAHTYLRA